MKRMIIRTVSLVLSLLLCAGAAAESVDDLSYTMYEKLQKQLNAGSGFSGTATLSIAAVEGRENDAYSTVKPLALNWQYIKAYGDAETGAPDGMRLILTLDQNDYQQGNAEFSVQEGELYMRSSLLSDGWYLIGKNVAGTVLDRLGIPDALPDSVQTLQSGGLMPGSASFFGNMAAYLISGDTAGISDAMEQYITKIDFWLEGYRDTVQMTSAEDGTSMMEIAYRLPAAAVKSQLKQLLIDLMNDEALLTQLQALMPEAQAEIYLAPSLQPYYFYAVDELPLEGELTIDRLISFLGETVALSVTMPMFDSELGQLTIVYERRQGVGDMPDDHTLSIKGEKIDVSINYRTYETMTGTTVYQGTVDYQGTDANGAALPILLADFDLSFQAVTTKDLNGYETQNMNLKFSVSPAELPEGADVAQYAAFSKTDLAMNMKFASLEAKNASTDVTVTLSLSGEALPEVFTLEIAGSTTAKWTPDPLDTAQAVNLKEMPADELQSFISQAIVKGGLLFLPYINLPQVTPEPAQ